MIRTASVSVLIVASLPALAEARDVPVATADELLAAIAGAAAGDVITLAPGTYALAGATCAASGTAEAPIVVRAATPLAARIEFDGVEGFKVGGAHWRFEDLDVVGVCAVDDTCEHAFHVTGDADGFVLRGSRVADFNAQLKVNAAQVGGTWQTPDGGLVEYNEVFDTRARQTANPVTKLNIDTGDDWVVRGNHLHDFEKAGGNTISYGAFLKSGGARGVFERNLVRCTTNGGGGVRIGLSLGGGGTAPQFCAPAFDAAVPCAVEHTDGVLRNNVIVGCSDVGIYLNRAATTRVLYNTLIATSGVDFRFDTTSGEAVGNVVSGVIRTRDGATFTSASNLENVAAATWQGWYADPSAADLTPAGDLAALVAQGPARADVTDDYCGAARPSGPYTLGAIEHAAGGCATVPPPRPGDDPTPPDAGDGGGGDAGDGDPTADGDAGGCGCASDGGSGGGGALPLLAAAALAARRRRRHLPACS